MTGQGKDAEPQLKPATALEQHATTLIGVIIAALLVWVGNTVTSTQVKVAEVSTQVGAVVHRLEAMESTLNEFRRDYVRRADYDRDQARIDARFENVISERDRR